MASLTRQRTAAALDRGPWEGYAARCVFDTRTRQAPRGPTDGLIRQLPEGKVAVAFIGGGIGMLWSSIAVTVETESVCGPALENRRGRAINHVTCLHSVRKLWKFPARTKPYHWLLEMSKHILERR